MKTQIKASAALALLVCGGFGCSAKVTGGTDPLGPLPFPIPTGSTDFKDQVNGPALDGVWKSQCIVSWRTQGDYQYVTLSVSGRNVTRRVDLFTDPSCTSTAQTQLEQGLFRYDAQLQDGTYNIEYQFNMPNGTYTQYENMILRAGSLRISDEVGGDAEPQVVMSNESGPTPVPSSSPSSIPTDGPTPEPAPTTTPGAPIHAGNHVTTYGDTVNYIGQNSGVVQTEQYVNQGFDSTNQSWTLYENIKGPTPEVGYEYYPTLWSSAQAISMFANCLTQNGTLQTVTVQAGTFDTCLLDNGTNKVWYGDVPVLGIVKLQSDDGTYFVSLVNYSWADASH